MSMGIGDHAVVQLPDFTGKSCDYLWAAVLSIWSGASCSSSTWRNSNLRLPVPSALPQILSNMSFPATDQLRTEHRAMERLLERFEGELRDPQGEGLLALAKTFAETQKHLAGHFAKEEEVFYPALAPSLSATDTMITKLIDDHSNVRETSSAFGVLLNLAPPGSELPVSLRADLSSLGWQLWNFIHHHIEGEEQGLLAFADRSLVAEAQTRLAVQMMGK